MAQVSISNVDFYFSKAQVSYFWLEFNFSLGELCTSTLQRAPCFSQGACMHLGPKTSRVELVFLSAWKSGYSLHYTIRPTCAIKYMYRHIVLLIFHLRCTTTFYVGVHLRNYFRTFCVSSIWNTPQCFSNIIAEQGSFLQCLLFTSVQKSISPSLDAILCLLHLLNDTKALQTLSFKIKLPNFG